METVPVTLGAVLPGTSGAPPLFDKAIGTDETTGLASTFLQELKNAVKENYGGIRGLNKAELATKQNVPPLDKEDEDKLPHPFGFTAIIPQTVPLLSPQLPGNGTGTNVDPTQTELSVLTTTKAEIMNVAKTASPDLPVPWLRGLNRHEQAQGKEQAQEQNSSVPASPAIVSEKSIPPEFAHPRDVVNPIPAPEVVSAIEKLGSAKASHSIGPQAISPKGKTANNHPDIQADVQVSTAPVPNNFGVISSPVAAGEIPPVEPANVFPAHIQSDNQSAKVAASIEIEVVPATRAEIKPLEAGKAKPNAQDSQPAPVQQQDDSSATESVNKSAATQSFKLAVEETLNIIATAPSQESTHASKIVAEPMPAKVSATVGDTPVVAAKQIHIPIQFKTPDHQDGDTGLPVPAKPFALEATPSVSDRSVSREVSLEIKSRRTETKAGEPVQKTDAASNIHDAAVPAPPSPLLHSAVQTDAVSSGSKDANALPQTLPAPTAHVPIPASSSLGKSAVPAVPADPTTLPALPDDKVQTARLVDRLGQAEMHLGVRTETFGSVQVHTVIRDSQVGLTIGSERGDLKSFLATEVSGLEFSLRQHDLHFNEVRFVGNSFSPGGNQYGGAGSQPQSFQQGRSYSRAAPNFIWRPESRVEIESVNDETTGLSIHA